MADQAVAVNDFILQVLPPGFLLGFSVVVSLLYFVTYSLNKDAADLVTTFHYLLVAAAYFWIVVYDPGATPGRAVFRLTLFHLLLNGGIRGFVDLPKGALKMQLRRAVGLLGSKQ